MKKLAIFFLSVVMMMSVAGCNQEVNHLVTEDTSTTKVIVEAGTLLETATSDEYGSVRFEKDYPFAKYSAKELTPIRERRKMWESRIPDVLDILKAGSEAAQKKAAATLHDVRSAMKINYFDADGLENDK